MDPTTGLHRAALSIAIERTPMAKTPNFRQAPTGVYKYPAVVLPPMVNLTKNTRDPGLPSRIQQPAPQLALNRTPAPSAAPQLAK
jgi:hypothetical protein